MSRDKLIGSITKLLDGLDEARLKDIYQFVLHISQ